MCGSGCRAPRMMCNRKEIRMKTAQLIGLTLVLLAMCACGSRKSLTRNDIRIHSDSIAQTLRSEVSNRQKSTDLQTTEKGEYQEVTILTVNKDTTGLRLTRTVTARNTRTSKNSTRQDVQQQTVATQTSEKQYQRKERSEKQSGKIRYGMPYVVLGGIVLIFLYMKRKR